MRLRATLPTGWIVHNDYPVIPGPRRAFSADLVLRDPSDATALAAEFKFEPSAARHDIQKHKLPVIEYADYSHDITRIDRFVSEGRCNCAVAILVDEGHRYATRVDNPRTQVDRWEVAGHQIDVHTTWAHTGITVVDAAGRAGMPT
jgi:hypothetical protein